MAGKWEKSGEKRKKMKGRDLKYGEGEKGEPVAGIMLAYALPHGAGGRAALSHDRLLQALRHRAGR